MTLATPASANPRNAPPFQPRGPARKRQVSRKVPVVAAILIAALAGMGTGGYFYFRAPAKAGILTYTVTPTNIHVRVNLSGELKATRNEEVRSLVEGVTTIISIVPEGSRVKEGDVLVQLSSDEIQAKIDDAKIRVENAKAAADTARDALALQDMQNDSDLKAAEMNEEVARLEYDKFVNGDAKTSRATLETAIINAETDLKRKTDDLAQTRELATKGFVSGNEVLDAEIAFRDSQNKLDEAKMAMEVWNKYDEPKQTQTLQSKRDETKKETERAKLRLTATHRTKETDLRAKQETFTIESTRLAFLEEQKAACTIKAPSGGMVVYQSSVGGGGGWNSNAGPIDEGAQVRQNQVLIQLPETSQMAVEVKIAEQMLDRVQLDQNAVVTVDAWPGKVMTGKVKNISVLADNSNRWANPLLKEYPTDIILDGEFKNLKPGMTARAEIQVAELEHVLGVPVQALYVNGGESYVFVGTAQAYMKRPVKTGLASADMVEIVDGLKEGETVLLSRPKDAPDDEPATRGKNDVDPNGDQTETKRADAPAGKQG